MTLLNLALVLVSAMLALAAGCLWFLMVAAAVNCRLEDDHWASFWSDTPITEGASPSRSFKATNAASELKKAA
jgi:hypothetical protein